MGDPTQYVAKMFICSTYGEYGSGQADIIIISYDIMQLSNMKANASWELDRIQNRAQTYTIRLFLTRVMPGQL